MKYFAVGLLAAVSTTAIPQYMTTYSVDGCNFFMNANYPACQDVARQVLQTMEKCNGPSDCPVHEYEGKRFCDLYPGDTTGGKCKACQSIYPSTTYAQCQDACLSDPATCFNLGCPPVESSCYITPQCQALRSSGEFQTCKTLCGSNNRKKKRRCNKKVNAGICLPRGDVCYKIPYSSTSF